MTKRFPLKTLAASSALLIAPLAAFAFDSIDAFTACTNRMLVVGHRGGWMCGCPENSRLSIAKAIELGIDMVEIDFTWTKDDKAVLQHDCDLTKTTTDGTGEIKDHTLAELEALDFSKSWTRWHKKDRIPPLKVTTLEEAMATFGHRTLWNVHGQCRTEAQAKEFCRIMAKYDMYDRVLWHAGSGWNLVHKIDPKIRELRQNMFTVEKVEEYRRQLARSGEKPAAWCQPRTRYLSKELFDAIHALGMRAMVFACDDRAEMVRIRAMGADGFLTNKPQLFADIFKESAQEDHVRGNKRE